GLATAAGGAPRAHRAGARGRRGTHPLGRRASSTRKRRGRTSRPVRRAAPLSGVADRARPWRGRVRFRGARGPGRRRPGRRAWAEFDAPGGTSLHSIWFNGALGGQTEGGCWEAGISAWTSDFYGASRVWGLQRCFVTSGGWIANQVVGLGGTTHVRVGIRCASSSGCQADWNGGHGVWANLRDVTVVVQDDQAPSVSPKRGALLDPG